MSGVITLTLALSFRGIGDETILISYQETVIMPHGHTAQIAYANSPKRALSFIFSE